MNPLRRDVQRRTKGLIFLLALVTRVTTANAQTGGKTEAEPSAAALVAARELFRQATEDVDAGRFDVALGKFRRVASVKETPAVRFNIARCEEQLGKLGAALNDLDTAVREASSDPKAADVAKMSQDRAAELRPRVPRLTLTPPPAVSDELIVKLDGERQPNATLGVPLPVDPGHHVVEASNGPATFRREVDLRERQAETVRIELSGGSADTQAPPTTPDTTPTKPHESGPSRVPGIIVLGVGAALAGTALVFGIIHNGEANDLADKKKQYCPGGKCPDDPNVHKILDPLQHDSDRDGSIAIGFGIAGGVVLLAGVYLLVFPPGGGSAEKKTAAIQDVRIVPGPRGAALVGRF